MNAPAQTVAIAVLALAGAGGTWALKGPPERVLRCLPEQLKADEVCLDAVPSEGVVWVDARPRKDWMANGLEGSMLWNIDPAEDMQAFEAEAVTRIASTPRVVVYCGDENCGVSRQVAARIRQLDLGAEVSVLHGGWRALREAGRVKDSNPAR